MKVLIKEEYAQFKCKMFNEMKVIQFSKLMRWHFCQVYFTQEGGGMKTIMNEKYYCNFYGTDLSTGGLS